MISCVLFKVEAPVRPVRPPAWDLDAILGYLNSFSFKHLDSTSLHSLTKKVLFLVSLATGKRVGELQAVSTCVAFASFDACQSYVPEFLAKTESSSNPFPHSFLVKSLSDFAVGLTDDMLLCPVRALRCYLLRTSSVQSRPLRLFVSPRSPSRVMSKNGISYFLREVTVFARRVLAERWVYLLEPIVSGESPPLLHFLRIGQCLVC